MDFPQDFVKSFFFALLGILEHFPVFSWGCGDGDPHQVQLFLRFHGLVTYHKRQEHHERKSTMNAMKAMNVKNAMDVMKVNERHEFSLFIPESVLICSICGICNPIRSILSSRIHEIFHEGLFEKQSGSFYFDHM